MNHEMYGYGLWGLVIINAAIFLAFAFSFFHPWSSRAGRSVTFAPNSYPSMSSTLR